MTLAELLAPHAVPPAFAARPVAGLSADSRAIQPGMVFFAVPGVKADGLAFAAQAAAQGAVAVVAERAAQGLSCPVVVVPNVRKALSLAAAAFYPRQPGSIAAVTGTSGKTSVAAFLRQIFAFAGHQAASIGTIGVVKPSGETYGSLTTPDPVSLHKTLDALAGEGVTHVAFEASSHGLDQHRLDGVRIQAAGFTNLTRDHLDYHPDFDAYRQAKLRLFRELLPASGTAVIMTGPESAPFAEAARARGQRLITIGGAGESIAVEGTQVIPGGQRLLLTFVGRSYAVDLPLIGAFQAENALVAAGLAMGCGVAPEQAFAALATLKGASGRLESMGEVKGASVIVDYAHKPDALEKALQALRPFAKGRLITVFGCGGDRDAGKRPLMGAIAARLSDHVIVTDDNPRSEDPALIRKAILESAPGAQEIADRAAAIRAGVAMLEPGDLLLIAGKGHETGQIVGKEVLPFSDQDEAQKAMKERA